MKYKVAYTEKAIKAIKKLDPSVQKMLKAWIERNLVETENPKAKGKGLTAYKSGFWRYRVGDYRIVADIQDKIVMIVVVAIGHRSDVYDK